jgi:toxin ParE1/3/4
VKRRAVVFAPEARDDLLNLYDWIADAAGPRVALAYLDRLNAFCLGFDLAAERGKRRDDLRPGLRVVGFERRITVAEHRVTILRLFSRGRDWEEAMS